MQSSPSGVGALEIRPCISKPLASFSFAIHTPQTTLLLQCICVQGLDKHRELSLRCVDSYEQKEKLCAFGVPEPCNVHKQ